MLAKIHLKTACGCTQSLFRRAEHAPRQIRMPIQATNIAFRVGHITPTEVYGLRDFHLVDAKPKSSYRIELWYEETLWSESM